MTVLANPMNVRSLTPLAKAAIRSKCIPDNRPLTATLECPAILDIAFLKKLDMTSFTKKGLIAISKICGISLIKRTNDKKIRKVMKRQTCERAKREARKKSVSAESSEDPAKGKVAAAKGIPKIKVSGDSKGVAKVECGKDGKLFSPRSKTRDGKPSVDDILYGHVEIVVTEPCKTCGRSEQPERFHSHPKQGSGKKEKIRSDESGRCPEGKLVAHKMADASKNPQRRYSTGHLHSETRSRLGVLDHEPSFHSDHEIESIKMSLPKVKATATANLKASPKAHHRKTKKNADAQMARSRQSLSVETSKSGDGLSPKRVGPRDPTSSTEDISVSDQPQKELKYVTGCYVCGEQMPPELRISHEEQCIAEWRRQNSQLPPDKRRAEPLRPDFRFTATGEVDFEGTFNSIWANHMDSLVPCGKCKRTFFPERIEKHEACCNGQSIRQKHPTPRFK